MSFLKRLLARKKSITLYSSAELPYETMTVHLYATMENGDRRLIAPFRIPDGAHGLKIKLIVEMDKK